MPLPAKLIHIDIDPAEHGKRYRPEVSIIADATLALNGLLDAVRSGKRPGSRWDEQEIAIIRDRLSSHPMPVSRVMSPTSTRCARAWIAMPSCATT